MLTHFKEYWLQNSSHGVPKSNPSEFHYANDSVLFLLAGFQPVSCFFALLAGNPRESARRTGGNVYTIAKMQNLVVSAAVESKITTSHNVTIAEVRQCLLNRKGRLLVDNRVLTKTNPPTLWFIADTNKVRALKIVYIQVGLQVHLKTAYEPNEVETAIYLKHGSKA